MKVLTKQANPARPSVKRLAASMAAKEMARIIAVLICRQPSSIAFISACTCLARDCVRSHVQDSLLFESLRGGQYRMATGLQLVVDRAKEGAENSL